MSTENPQESMVWGGVDTHADTHTAAVVDHLGRQLGAAEFKAVHKGYFQLWNWMNTYGQVAAVGIEGTGSYGAGLSRFLQALDAETVEVDRPNRQTRQREGKSDTADALAAARAVLSGRAAGTPKAATGGVEALRVLTVARRSAVKARTQAILQIRDLIVTAPSPLREQLQPLPAPARIQTCARLRPNSVHDPHNAVKTALRALARRCQTLTTEIQQHDHHIQQLCAQINPALLSARGVGPQTAAALLIAAGDNPHRLRSRAAFAALCGAAPVPASSGKTGTRHRLNRGGNRQANHALWTIAVNRLRTDPRTQTYRNRRRAQGKTNPEIIRCLKRYIANEIHTLLTNPPPTPDPQQLRALRQQARITLQTAANHLQTTPTRLSQLERGLQHNTPLTTRYHTWLTTQQPN